MTLGQIVPIFTGQVVSSRILRIFRWKLWVTLCSIVKLNLKHKKHVKISWRFQAVLLCLNEKKNFQFFVIFPTNETFLQKIVLSYIAAHYSKLIFLFNWVWISVFMELNVVWQLAPVTGKVNNHSVTIEGNPILFNCRQGFTQNFRVSQPS